MSGKIIALRLAFFLLAFGCGFACTATEPMKGTNMAESLNAQWNEQLYKRLEHIQRYCDPKLKLIETADTRPSLNRPRPFSCGCVYMPLHPNFQEDVHMLLLWNAFLGASKLQILTVDTSGLVEPRLATILWDELHEGFLIQKRTTTSDQFARKFIYDLVGSALEHVTHEEFANWISGDDTLEKEYSTIKSDTRFSTHYVLEFQGENWAKIELDMDRFQILVRTKDNWGYSRFDKSYAAGIKTYINDLHSIYATDSAEP